MAKSNAFKQQIAGLLPSQEEVESYFDRLWPICRSITGDGVRQSFAILQELLPVELVEVPSGQKVLDWTVPNEWNIEDAFVEDESGQRVIDFRNSNLHVLGYSVPVDQWLFLEELQALIIELPFRAHSAAFDCALCEQGRDLSNVPDDFDDLVPRLLARQCAD